MINLYFSEVYQCNRCFPVALSVFSPLIATLPKKVDSCILGSRVFLESCISWPLENTELWKYWNTTMVEGKLKLLRSAYNSVLWEISKTAFTFMTLGMFPWCGMWLLGMEFMFCFCIFREVEGLKTISGRSRSHS